jgi:hypothetical protein
MTPHKHAELIKAWADGSPIQYRAVPNHGDWKDAPEHLIWDWNAEYRIKPREEYVKYRDAFPLEQNFCPRCGKRTNDIHTCTPPQRTEQEPVAYDQTTMELAESVGLIGPASRTHDLHDAIQRFHDLICANATIKAAVAFSRTLEAKDEPVAWKWHQAPVKTLWGHEMVVADIAIDKDNTVSVYCERDQTAKVEAMFTTPPQRTWVGLTDEEIANIGFESADRESAVIQTIDKLKELNT